MIDLSTLTLGEVAFIEELSGQALDAIGNDGAPKGKSLAAIATVIKRRNGFPTFKFNDALALSFAEVNELLGMNEEVDEDSDEGKDEASEKPAPKTKRNS